MIEIGRTIISRNIFEKKFMCDLSKCKGACCIEGDSGAPLTTDEAGIIQKLYPVFREYLPEENIELIEKSGFAVIDNDGDLVTPLIGNGQCAYSFYDKNGILSCSIEKAFNEKNTNFQKPLSCYLFPIRITEYKKFDAINYEKLDICKPALVCGEKMQMPLFRFLKEPLTRKYGEEWYKELEIAANHIQNKKI
jgi:hypothetical protein